MLNVEHLAMLAASGITPEHAAARGYETITDTARLADINIVRPGRRTPGLLVPQLRADGSTWGYQYRPDEPRLNSRGKPIKYETPWQQANGLDIPPGVGARLADPAIPLWITEGVKKADCGAQHDLCIVALSGVWNWLHTNSAGGKMAFPDWRDIALNDRRTIIAFDGDVTRKESVQKALHHLGQYLAHKGATVEYLHLPDTDKKTGLDDYLMNSHDASDLWRLVKPTAPTPAAKAELAPVEKATPEPETLPAQPVSLDAAHAVFLQWLGHDYDTDALDAVLAAAAVEQLDGDPLWLLVISGPGNAKTETVQSLNGIGAVLVSTISSAGALLSATAERERSKQATGGLLRLLEPRGVLVIKDATSILSMNRDTRAEVLAALREVFDGLWSRNVGSDGGKTLTWRGRIAVIGAVTTAWDTAHSVIAAMGDRFVTVRIDSTASRFTAGRKAIGNTGSEPTMRAELAAAAAGVLAGMTREAVALTDDEIDTLLRAADLVTLARTAVECDHQGNVIDAHAPEMPTRFAKQLAQVVRGGIAIGMDRAAALRLAIRCARDSMPPLRLAIIDYIAAHPHTSTQEVRKGIDKPRLTVDRQLQALHILGVLTVDEVPYGDTGERHRWFYTLRDDIDATALSCPNLSVPTPSPLVEKRGNETVETHPPQPPSDISGQLKVEPARTFQPHSCAGCGEELTRPESIESGRCAECTLGAA